MMPSFEDLTGFPAEAKEAPVGTRFERPRGRGQPPALLALRYRQEDPPLAVREDVLHYPFVSHIGRVLPGEERPGPGVSIAGTSRSVADTRGGERQKNLHDMSPSPAICGGIR